MKVRRCAAFAVLAAAGFAGAFIAADLWLSYRRIGRGSRVVASPLGDLEYRRGGAGPAVLVIHGSGGGFDQGELLAQAVLGEDFDWIAPSRLGYLRSALPPTPNSLPPRSPEHACAASRGEATCWWQSSWRKSGKKPAASSWPTPADEPMTPTRQWTPLPRWDGRPISP